MSNKQAQPFNISVSWTQPLQSYRVDVSHWTDKMDDTQLEILIQDMLSEHSDYSEASAMLEAIGIKC
jgi:hypothetical protein